MCYNIWKMKTRRRTAKKTNFMLQFTLCVLRTGGKSETEFSSQHSIWNMRAMQQHPTKKEIFNFATKKWPVIRMSVLRH